MQLLKDVIDESVMGLTRTMVTREEQDKVPQRAPKKPKQLLQLGILIVDGLSTKSRLCPATK